MTASNIVEITSFFQNKTHKKFTFNAEGITVEKLLSFDTPVFIPSEDINAFRYGIVWARGYQFVLGRQYVIETKDFKNKVFKIKLNSYYGIRRKAYYEAWCEIINQLWRHYFSNMLNYYVDLYNIQQIFELAGVKFLPDGISWSKKDKLLWKEIALKNYRTYFVIHHAGDPYRHKSCSFANDWNAFILQRLLKHIIDQHQ